MNFEDVGQYFTTDGNDIWQMVDYCGEPTATMENLKTKKAFKSKNHNYRRVK